MSDLVLLDVLQEWLETETSHVVARCAVDGTGGYAPQLAVGVIEREKA